MTVYLHEGDLPADVMADAKTIAVDSETMGLHPHRDRLCVVQISAGDGDAHLVKFSANQPYQAPNLSAMLANPRKLKIFHYARFDIAVIEQYLGVTCAPVYCTKIASRLTRTYTDRHGLKDLCRELLGVDLSKQQQSSDWGADVLSDAQQNYAASDVLYLHQLMAVLEERLAREGRSKLAAACFQFLPTRAALDLRGWPDQDIFAHS
ncbi:MAG: ribonuclease H-like domain-containing protein [Pseudomonadota bacterium]